MYVLPYHAMRSNIDAFVKNNPGQNTVNVPENLLKLMLQIIISNDEFDEVRYLRANPDVAEAVRRGEIASGRMHYIGFGYFENRPGSGPEVNVNWYEKTYPDVAQAIRNGRAQVKTAAEHFQVAGAAEGRAPNASSLEDAQLWKNALGL